MARKIIGRERGRSQLNKILESEEPAFLALYGRRRIEKTCICRQRTEDGCTF